MAIIPPGAQGVRVGGSQTFDTTFARVLGIPQFTASADATAVTGALTGGEFLPVVFPVSLANCDGSGNTIVTDEPWRLSDPNPDPNLHADRPGVHRARCARPGPASFQILDLDPNLNCEEEVLEPAERPVPVLPGRRPDRPGQRLRQEDRGRDRRQGPPGRGRDDPDLRRRLPHAGFRQRQVLPRHPDRGVLPRLPVLLEQQQQRRLRRSRRRRRTGPTSTTSSAATAAPAASPAGSSAG